VRELKITSTEAPAIFGISEVVSAPPANPEEFQETIVAAIARFVAPALLGLAALGTSAGCAHVALALVLEPMFENSLRQSLTLAQGHASIFFVRPISATLLAVSALAVLWMSLSAWRRHQRVVTPVLSYEPD
jgi:TctA family transporter